MSARVNKQYTSLLAALLLTAALVAACEPGDPGRSTGAYPIEIFPEMHYNPSMKAAEPPRLLPPENSYPVTGGPLPVGNKQEERDRPNPLTPTEEVISYGAALYQVNCSMCHGQLGGGNGPTGQALARYGATAPPALDSARMQGLTPGEKFASISNSFGFMPAFGGLLSAQERWAIITMIEAPAAEREAALEATRELTSEQRALSLLELAPRIGP